MSEPAVSIHPYFKIHPGKLEAVKALLTRFVEKTSNETNCVAYEFTINGDLVFCRETYAGAEGALAHLANAGPQLAEMRKTVIDASTVDAALAVPKVIETGHVSEGIEGAL